MKGPYNVVQNWDGTYRLECPPGGQIGLPTSRMRAWPYKNPRYIETLAAACNIAFAAGIEHANGAKK